MYSNYNYWQQNQNNNYQAGSQQPPQNYPSGYESPTHHNSRNYMYTGPSPPARYSQQQHSGSQSPLQSSMYGYNGSPTQHNSSYYASTNTSPPVGYPQQQQQSYQNFQPPPQPYQQHQMYQQLQYPQKQYPHTQWQQQQQQQSGYHPQNQNYPPNNQTFPLNPQAQINQNGWPDNYEIWRRLACLPNEVGRTTWLDLLSKEWDNKKWKEMFNEANQVENRDYKKQLFKLVYLYTINNKSVNIVPTSTKTSKVPYVTKLLRSPSTTVSIVNIDIIDALISIQKTGIGTHIGCLCFANENTPGGNIKIGEVAQEETLFCATNISTSLNESCGLYPISEDEMIYTSNVTVLRKGVKDGFAFLPLDERFTIDIMSVAAFRGYLNREKILKTRRKIEQLIAKSIESGVDVLVLGALGCGMHENDPKVVSALFHAILSQYAGYFIKVYFVIYSPSNRIITEFARELLIGNDNVFDGAKKRTIENACKLVTIDTREVNDNAKMVYKAWCGGSFSVDYSLPFCSHGGLCEGWGDPEHSGQFSHPPECQFGPECKDKDDLHRMMFCHKLTCPDWGKCERYYIDSAHRNTFIHPSECVDGPRCTSRDTNHLHDYVHYPSCEEGLKCPNINDQEHCKKFRHIKEDCSLGTKCPLFVDPEHIRIYDHPFGTVCKDTPFVCTDDSQEHMNEFSHVCGKGSICDKMDNPEHIKHYIHAGAICKDGANCTDITEEHIASFFHPDALTFRKPCSETWCKDFSIQHRREFAHHRNDAGRVPIIMINTRDPKNTDSLGDFAEGKEWHMDAEANARKLIAEADAYLGVNVGMDSPNIKEITDWFKRCRPMHMCLAEVFLSILNLKGITSLHVLKRMWLKKDDLINTITNNSKFIDLGINDPEIFKMVTKYLKLYIKKKQTEMKPSFIKEAIEYDRAKNAKRKSFESESNLTATIQDTEVISENEENKLKVLEVSLDAILVNVKRAALDGIVNKIIQDIKTVLLNLPGCQGKCDIKPRLDYTAFTVVGPHYHDYGGTQVVLVLRPEIMFHPDYYDTPISASMYSLGLAGNNNWGKKTTSNHIKHPLDRTSWHANEGNWGHGGSADFFSSKMHRTAPSYYEAFVKEWLCRVKKLYGIEPANATLVNVKEAWTGYNAHYVTEGHLPGRTPIDYIEAIIMLQSAHDEAIKDDLGKAFIEKYKAAGLLRVVNTKIEVNAETGKYIEDTPLDPINYPTGFCFVMNDEDPCFMPFSLNTNKEVVHFSFMAHGAPFCVAVSDAGDFKGNGDKPLKAITFKIGVDGLCVTSFSDTLCRSEFKRVNEFNANCPLNTFVHYSVTIDYGKKVATLRHWGPSSVYNRSEVPIKLEDNIRYSYISFNSVSKDCGNTVIWNVREDSEPLSQVEPDITPVRDTVK